MRRGEQLRFHELSTAWTTDNNMRLQWHAARREPAAMSDVKPSVSTTMTGQWTSDLNVFPETAVALPATPNEKSDPTRRTNDPDQQLRLGDNASQTQFSRAIGRGNWAGSF
jgi:hypothetical protein